MYKEKFKNLISIIDKEMSAYESLKELFIEKKELLIKAKSDDLGVVDNKILAINDTIVKLNKVRQEASVELIGKDGCMSDFIAFAQEHQPELVDGLKERKVKI